MNNSPKQKILEFLQQADKNITNFEYFQEEVVDKETKNKSNWTVDLRLSRPVYKDNKVVNSDFWTPALLESSGTIKMFDISGAILSTLENGGVLFIDEIDTQLHPLLVRNLVKLFNSIHNNPHNAQLICSTHDVLLLEENIRRDQIYFTEKNEFGVSSLYSLSEFKGIRKENKLLKLYLLGAFGAIPKLKELFIHKKVKAM
jgi:hypothetical protein